MVTALLGTDTGVYRLDGHGITSLGLPEHRISAVHAWRSDAGATIILAGTYGDGQFRSEDGGAHWHAAPDGLTAPAIRTIIPDPTTKGAILCGTEPARIFRSRDGGRMWQNLAGIENLPSAADWYLPYSPRAGVVRNIYSPPGSRRLLASVEVGGLIESADGGETWSYLPVLGDTDIHHVTGHPHDPDSLYAALGWASLKKGERPAGAPPLGGVARSRDGGRTWTKFHSNYTRAVIVPPARPDLLLAGPATKVGAVGRIEVSEDEGETWRPAGDGIEQPMRDMVELFVPAPDGSIWAICSAGRLLRAVPGEWQWRSPLPTDQPVRVRSVAFLSGDRDAGR